MGLPHANARALRRRVALVRATAFALAAAFAAALSAAEARASSPRPDDSATHEVRTCKGESFALTAPEYESVKMHNQARGEAGLPHLCVNPTLTRAARGHAADMLDRDYFSHDSPEGVEPVDRMMDGGYSGFNVSGENIAYASGPLADSEPIFDSLIRSPDHRENILRAAFLEVGVGAVASADGSTGMYVMDFGARLGQPREYPRLLSDAEGEAAPPEEATTLAPLSGEATEMGGGEAAHEAAQDPAAEEASEGEHPEGGHPAVEDHRQAILCEIFARTSGSIIAGSEDGAAFADGFGWSFPAPCARFGEAQHGGVHGTDGGSSPGFAPHVETASP